MNPYIAELKERYGLEDDFLNEIARDGDVLIPLVEMLANAGDHQAAEELRRLPELLRSAGYGKD